MDIKNLLFWSILFLFACNNEKEPTEPAPSTEPSIVQSDPIKYKAALEYLRLRDQPGESGKVVTMLTKGDTLIGLEEFSNFKTKIKLRGLWMNEPWVKVAKNDSIQGWVYAGGLEFFQEQMKDKRLDFLIENRLESIFGKQLTESIFTYRNEYERLRDSEGFANIFLRGSALRDSLTTILEEKIEITDYEKMPDLSWLEVNVPGYEIQLVAEGTLVHLFMNYKEMYKKARQTKGQEDDEFIDLCFQIYALDSIEHFYPSWFLQTWDYGGHSELGSRKHFTILQKMNRLLAESNIFEPKIEQFKLDLLNDITDAETSYWNTQSEILEELDSILSAEFGILSKEDKMSLQVRKKMFESAEENGIQLNHRAGIHDL